ncbi:MAG: phage head-tail joining protein [Rhodospirillaceae bacterium]
MTIDLNTDPLADATIDDLDDVEIAIQDASADYVNEIIARYRATLHAYWAGASEVEHNGKKTKFRSRNEMKAVLQDIKRQIFRMKNNRNPTKKARRIIAIDPTVLS